MRRRRFLASAASAFPLALAQPFARALPVIKEQPGSDGKELHIVLDGEDRFGETHPTGFSHIFFKTSPDETSGNLFVIETRNVTAGPPLHMHLEQEEWFYIMEGEVLFQVGEKRVRLKPGDSMLAPRKMPHTFRPVSATPARMLIAFSPAGKMEEFFRATMKPNPPALDDAALWRRFGMELLGPPIKA